MTAEVKPQQKWKIKLKKNLPESRGGKKKMKTGKKIRKTTQQAQHFNRNSRKKREKKGEEIKEFI